MSKENQKSILTIGQDGVSGYIVTIETVIRRGIFQFDIIGLANKTISESKQRILSAISSIQNEKRHYINKKITTLLSPADTKKDGSYFDLPIAFSYLLANKLYSDSKNAEDIITAFSNIIILGELNLSGLILPIKNISALVRIGLQSGISHFIIPENSQSELKNFPNIHIWSIGHISEITDIFKEKHHIKEYILSKFNQINLNIDTTNFKSTRLISQRNLSHSRKYLVDSIEGCHYAKRALEIAISGKHHLLLIGTPGCGKSLLAKSSKEFLPNFTDRDANIFQIKKIDSLQTKDITQINFREPHHTSSYSEIIGNRNNAGEIVLSHSGILFLDELSEFDRRVIESIRQPLENKYIQRNITNSQTETSLDLIPTDFILIGCMNPCNCGYFKSENKKCICTQGQIDKYKRKINSPLFQRFDMCVYMQENSKDITHASTQYQHKQKSNNFSGDKIKENIERVREIQYKRMLDATNFSSDSLENTEQNTKYIFIDRKALYLQIDIHNKDSLEQEVNDLLEKIKSQFNFSKREEYSLLRVARTIADLEKSKDIQQCHILEALSYKNKQ